MVRDVLWGRGRGGRGGGKGSVEHNIRQRVGGNEMPVSLTISGKDSVVKVGGNEMSVSRTVSDKSSV